MSLSGIDIYPKRPDENHFHYEFLCIADAFRSIHKLYSCFYEHITNFYCWQYVD